VDDQHDELYTSPAQPLSITAQYQRTDEIEVMAVTDQVTNEDEDEDEDDEQEELLCYCTEPLLYEQSLQQVVHDD
jgi:hypothetical protein